MASQSWINRRRDVQTPPDHRAKPERPPELPPSPLTGSAHNPQPVGLSQWGLTAARPLSDIREMSEPSMIDTIVRRPDQLCKLHQQDEITYRDDLDNVVTAPRSVQQPDAQQPHGPSSSYSTSSPDERNIHDIPSSSIPRRSSSQHQRPSRTREPASSEAQQSSFRARRSPPHRQVDQPVERSALHHGHSESPIKEAILRSDPFTSDAAQHVPSRTRVRSLPPGDLLDYPFFKHPRVKLDLEISSPVFVGGATIEGHVRLTIDNNERVKHRRTLSIGSVSVDVVGFEDVGGSQKCAFLALGTELVDAEHPPPTRMVQPPNPLFDDGEYWSLLPSTTILPFTINLPLDTGPPPFQSKHANIRFLLAVTAVVRDAGKYYQVRSSQNVHILPTHDPERVLCSLPSPLTASDEMPISHGGAPQVLRLIAGMHRQIWVSGSSLFVDVYTSNKCRKAVRRLELSLERDILRYRHAAATTLERTANEARIFENNERSVIASQVLKQGQAGWNGVQPHGSDTRTCELEIPRGHGTVRCGKYFEVRYFLNASASISSSKRVSVQLPVVLIHMGSLDVVPNSAAQVAAALEESQTRSRRTHARSRSNRSNRLSTSSPLRAAGLPRRPSCSQGRAFAVPRQQSLQRQRSAKADIVNLKSLVDASPRKQQHVPLRGLAIRHNGEHSGVSVIGLNLNKANDVVETHLTARPLGTSQPSSSATSTAPRWGMRKNHEMSSLTENVQPQTESRPLRPMRSFGTKRSGSSIKTTRKASDQMTVLHHTHAGPHVLGLIDTMGALQVVDQGTRFGRDNTFKDEMVRPSVPADNRPATATGLRDRLDRSRFEFSAVRRKASGSFKDRSLAWLRRSEDKRPEGNWI